MSEPTAPQAEPDRDQPSENVVEDHHTYDGITEYDNPIPGWWKWLFIGSIVFSPLYLMWFHAPNMERDLHGRYEQAVAINMQRRFGEIGELKPDAPTILAYMEDPTWLSVGKSVFATNCVSCHGADGQGVTGPNLTDESFINVRAIEDIAKVVNDGANGGAMPAWSNRLHPNEVVLVASYVATLRGRDLPGRAAEGNAIPAWPTGGSSVEAADSEVEVQTGTETETETPEGSVPAASE